MTDHLPECPWPEKPCGPDHEPMHDRQPLFCVACLTECDCDRLRACEQRVFQEQIAGRQYDMVMGYQRGLSNARRVVQLLPKGGMGLKAHQLWRDALAAIDALREGDK